MVSKLNGVLFNQVYYRERLTLKRFFANSANQNRSEKRNKKQKTGRRKKCHRYIVAMSCYYFYK